MPLAHVLIRDVVVSKDEPFLYQFKLRFESFAMIIGGHSKYHGADNLISFDTVFPESAAGRKLGHNLLAIHHVEVLGNAGPVRRATNRHHVGRRDNVVVDKSG